MRATLSFAAVLSAALLSPGVSHAQDAASARSFVESAYRHYSKDRKGVDFTGPHANQYFHSSLISLIRADEKAVGQEIPICCDGDPLCDCQEFDGIWDLKIEIQMESPRRALASVSFALFGPSNRSKDDIRKLKITLVPERGQWRIYDILFQTPQEPPSDFRNDIQKEITYIAQHPNS